MRYHGFKRVPTWITSAVQAADSDQFEVAATRVFSSGDSIDDLRGLVSEASLEAAAHDDGETAVLPPPGRGRWSKWNVHGKIEVLRDRPKTEKTFSWESPNFGDPSRGHHTVVQVREVWQRRTLYGNSTPLLVSVRPLSRAGEFRVIVRVDHLFDRRNYSAHDLLLAVSLLQENFGAVSVRPTDRSMEEWAEAQSVRWEFLPPGEGGRPPAFDAVKRHFNLPDNAERTRIAEERYRRINEFRPTSTIVGVGGFARYIGFRFRDDLVALENLDYGNAVYLMYEDWEVLSRRSRVDLLGDSDANYDRIVHTSGWEERLRHRLQLKGHETD